MRTPVLRGLWGFALTPFVDDVIDSAGFRAGVRGLVDGGADVGAAGTLVQGDVMDRAEREMCLREAVDEVVVVTSEELEPPPVDALLVRDSAPAEGPLQGLAEGLARVEAPLAFVTGTDAPFLRADFVRAMLAFGVPVALVQDGFVQTLAAVYPREVVKQALAANAAGSAKSNIPKRASPRSAATAIPTSKACARGGSPC